MRSNLVARLGTISGMATAAVACSNSADAAVYSQVVGQTLSTTSTISLAAANLDPSFSPNFLVDFRASVFGDQYLWAPGTPMDFINDGTFSNNNLGRLGPNVLVGAAPAINFWYRATNTQSTANDIQFGWGADGDTGFAGIRFVGGASFFYGWIEMTRLAGGAIRVDSWALESSPNTPILNPSGAVPEPASAGIFALAAGAAGVRALRRRSLKNASV